MASRLKALNWWRFPRRPRWRRSIAALVSAAALGFGLVGCARGPQADRRGTDAAANSSAAWPFWPTRMEITPLTRMVPDPLTGGSILEARIEFRDAQGFTSRAAGRLYLEVRDGALPIDSDPVQRKDRDLRDIAVNQQHFDIVTRTYLFRLETIRDAWPADPVLHVIFNSIDGKDMTASRRITR